MIPGKSSRKVRAFLEDRATLARAFIAKTILRLPTVIALIERLQMDRALQRICGFDLRKALPSESTFSRAFDEMAKGEVALRCHAAFIQFHLGDQLICHITRDGTAIEARERPASRHPRRATSIDLTVKPAQKEITVPETAIVAATPAAVKTASAKPKRGRPKKGEVRPKPEGSRLEKQRTQSLAQMMKDLPTQCDRGSKCNAQGYKNSWNGYKLHLDVADGGIPISVILTSASVHDSQVAIPLATMTAQRVTNCYDVMDAAYCSKEIHAHSIELGHAPLIDHNPRGGVKRLFDYAETVRYKIRTQSERANARLKDEFGAGKIFVRGDVKVMSHLMFGVLALTVDQMFRLLT